MRDEKTPIAWPSDASVYIGCRRVVEQHEVHIGGIIQFTGAELAHAEYREAPAACRVRGIRQAQLARVVGGSQQVRHGEGQGGFREVAQRRGDALEWPDAADVGDGGRQGDNAFGATHGGGDPVAAGGGRHRRQVGHGRRNDHVRTRCDEGSAGLAASRTARSAR